MGRFAQRSTALEKMDDLDCSGPVVDQTLRELETINTWLGGNAVSIGALTTLLQKSANAQQPLHIGDLGCGGGDLLYRISKWGSRKGYRLRLTGIDANQNIIEYARKKFSGTNLEFQTMNIFGEEFRAKTFDVVIGTLFFHHFSDHQLTTFFRQLRSQVRIGWIINDIHRHWLAYHSIRFITHLFSRSPMVKTDAPLSVLRAFSKRELLDILEHAGVSNYKIRWRWAFRWQIIVFV